MTNEIYNLAQNLIQRIKTGKRNSVLLQIRDKPWLSTTNVRFEVIEYTISLQNSSGKKILISGGNIANETNPEKQYSLFMDDKGVKGNCVRFILFEGEVPISSSIDTIAGHVYIAIKRGSSDMPHVISFTIVRDSRGTNSSFINDGDSHIFQYCKYTSMLLTEGY